MIIYIRSENSQTRRGEINQQSKMPLSAARDFGLPCLTLLPEKDPSHDQSNCNNAPAQDVSG